MCTSDVKLLFAHGTKQHDRNTARTQRFQVAPLTVVIVPKPLSKKITICVAGPMCKHCSGFSKNVRVCSVLLTVTCSHTSCSWTPRCREVPLLRWSRRVDFLNPSSPINHTVRKQGVLSFSLITH